MEERDAAAADAVQMLDELARRTGERPEYIAAVVKNLLLDWQVGLQEAASRLLAAVREERGAGRGLGMPTVLMQQHGMAGSRLGKTPEPLFSRSGESMDAGDAGYRRQVEHSVMLEMMRQRERWGADRNLAPALWQTVALEEFGETARALLGGDANHYRLELVQVAAVAIAALVDLDWQRDRKPGPPQQEPRAWQEANGGT